MPTTENPFDAIIIGGGFAGLTTAILLARQGKRVGLFEQAQALGGRARTKEQNGFYFNLGPHALYRGGAGFAVLGELGITPRGKTPATAGAYAIKDGVKHTFPSGPTSLLTTSLLSLSGKLEAAKVLATLGKVDANQFLDVSVQQWIDTNYSHPTVKELLLALNRVTTYANAPERMSAGAAIRQLQYALTSNVLYLDGGWQVLVDELEQLAIQIGVTIETGAKAVRVSRNAQGGARAVQLADGRLLEAPIIVIAASPGLALKMVENGETTSLAKWAEQAVPIRAACLDIALKFLPHPKATFALSLSQPLYLSVHSAAAQLAPAGGALIHVAKYLPTAHTTTAQEDEQELEALLDLVQPGWRAALVERRFLPELIVAHAIPLTEWRGTMERPGPDVPEVAGLYVVGDWVGNEGQLADASFASAKQAAELIACLQQPTASGQWSVAC